MDCPANVQQVPLLQRLLTAHLTSPLDRPPGDAANPLEMLPNSSLTLKTLSNGLPGNVYEVSLLEQFLHLQLLPGLKALNVLQLQAQQKDILSIASGLCAVHIMMTWMV